MDRWSREAEGHGYYVFWKAFFEWSGFVPYAVTSMFPSVDNSLPINLSSMVSYQEIAEALDKSIFKMYLPFEIFVLLAYAMCLTKLLPKF